MTPFIHAPYYRCLNKELEDENSFKDKQLKSSELTMKRLQHDKEKRQQEMEKINTLDEKVKVLCRRSII